MEHTLPSGENGLWPVSDWFRNGGMEYCHAYHHRLSGRINAHRNEFCELNIVLEGSAEHQINDRVYNAEQGSVYFIPAGMPHSWESASGAIIFHALILEEFFERYDQELHTLPGYTLLFEVSPYISSETQSTLKIQLTRSCYDDIAPYIKTLIDYCKSEYAGRDVVKNAALMSLIGVLSASVDKLHSRHLSGDHSQNTIPIARSMEYIRINAAQKLTIEQLAKDAHMSRSTYIRNFTAVSGNTPMQFLTQCRMANARKLLCYSNLPITEVALECGFYDASHFIHMFTRQERLSPSDYRALNAGRVNYSVCSICTRPIA